MSEPNTIKTSNSRKLYLPYYFAFICTILICLFLFIQGKLALQALIASFIIVFLGINITEIHRIGQSYEINPQEVVHSKGYLSRNHKRIDLHAINTVTVHQTLFDRLLNIGDVHIHVANSSHETILKNLHAPKIFAKTIQNNMFRARNKQLFEQDKQNFSQPLKKEDSSFSEIEETDAEISKRLQEI